MTELLPGISAGAPQPVDASIALDDAVLVDIDGDGEDEVIGIQRDRSWVEIERSGDRSTLRRVDAALQAIETGDFDGDGILAVADFVGSAPPMSAFASAYALCRRRARPR